MLAGEATITSLSCPWTTDSTRAVRLLREAAILPGLPVLGTVDKSYPYLWASVPHHPFTVWSCLPQRPVSPTWNLYISPLRMLLSTVPPKIYMASEITAAAWKSLPLGSWRENGSFSREGGARAPGCEQGHSNTDPEGGAREHPPRYYHRYKTWVLCAEDGWLRLLEPPAWATQVLSLPSCTSLLGS